MILFDFIVALVVAILAGSTLVLMGGDGRRYGPGGALLFVLLFLLVWVGGVWLTPVGPAVGGVYVLGFLFVGVFVTLVFAALAPPPPRSRLPIEHPAGVVEGQTPAEVEARLAEQDAADAADVGLGLLFWVLLGLLALAALISYWPGVREATGT